MTTKILIVEDNFIASDETKDRLNKLGFTDCETAFTGEEAIEKAKKFQPDLILMDINLGEGIDGIETAERIHQQQRVPIIYLTAYDDDATLKRAKITDPYAYIVKPFEEKELHRAIDIALYKHETEEKLRESEERLETIFNTSPFPVTVADVNDENILYWSESAKEMFGHSPKTVSEWYSLAYPDPEYRKEVIERWKPMLEKARESTQAVNTGEYKITCKDQYLSQKIKYL
jgi:PAS domain S-box-containing protein